MTLVRQYSSAALLAVALLAPGAAWAAEGTGDRGQGTEVIGPPTAEAVAAAAAERAEAEKAKAAADAAAAKAKQPAQQPAWLANRPAPKAATGKNATPSTGRMVGLVVVLGALALAAMYFRKRSRGELKGKTTAAPKRLSVLSSTRIGPKAHAVVISVNGRQMLLGVTDSSVERLALLDELEAELDEERLDAEPRLAVPGRLAAQAVRAAAPREPAQSRSFAEVLKTAFKKPTPTPEADPALLLAAETHDVVGGKPVVSNVRMLDVEGQAQGLIRRLSGPRA